MTAPALAQITKQLSEILDPTLVSDLIGNAKDYDRLQKETDDSAWNIAGTVNDAWDEHKNIVRDGSRVFPTKLEYYAECSRVANIGLPRKRFSDSGETLRRWCETRARYDRFVNNVKDSEKFLDLLSFDHLYKAGKLYVKEKVKSPFLALAEAVKMSYTADEMYFHYDPPTKPNEWDVMTDRVQAMESPSFWKLKSGESLKQVLFHVKEIARIIKEDK